MNVANRFGTLCRRAVTRQSVRCFAAKGDAFEGNYAKLQKDFPGLFPDEAAEQGEWSKWFDADITKAEVGKVAKQLSGTFDAATLDSVGLGGLDEAAVVGNKGKIVGTGGVDFEDFESKISAGEAYINDILAGVDPAKLDERGLNEAFVKATQRSNLAEEYISKSYDAPDIGRDLPVKAYDVEEFLRGYKSPEFENNADAWSADEAKNAKAFVAKADTDFYAFIEKQLDAGSAGADEKVAQGLMKDLEAYFNGREAARQNYQKGMDEVFNDQDISHYNFNKYAKSLFSCALWESAEKAAEIEQGLAALRRFVNSDVDCEPEIIRRAYENQPDLPRSKNLQPQTFDPFFTPRLVSAIREAVDAEQIDTAFRGAFAEQFLGVTQSGKTEIDAWRKDNKDQKYIQEPPSELYTNQKTVDASVAETKAKYDAAESAINAASKSVEQIVEEVLRKKLWVVAGDEREGAVKGLVAEVTNWFKKKGGDIDALDGKIQAALPAGNQEGGWEEGTEMTLEDRKVLVAFHNTRISSPDLLSFTNLLCEWPYKSKRRPANIQKKVSLAKERLQAEGFDPLIVETVVSMVEDRKGFLIHKLLDDYAEISKKFRGEVHGTIRSAFPLSQTEYDTIVATLKDKNPGKNFFLDQEVDSGLLGGFTVQAGVQRLDFSLASEVDSFRRSQA